MRRHVRVLAEQSAASRKGDTLQLFANAEFAARSIPGARLLAFEHGGHVVTIVEQAAIRAAVREHVLGHARAAR